MLTAEVDEPVRAGPRSSATRAPARSTPIVEERDATAEQRAITEINAGDVRLRRRPARARRWASSPPTTSRARSTSPTSSACWSTRAAPSSPTPPATRPRCSAATTGSSWPGCARILRDRINTEWMRAGVTIVDPATTWIDVTVTARPRRRDRAQHPPARRHHDRRPGAAVGPDTTLDRHHGGRGRQRGPGPRGRAPRSARGRRWARTRTCGPAPCCASGPRSARSSR